MTIDIQSYKPDSDKVTDYLDELSKFIFASRYSRYNPKLQRRNTWEESIDNVLEMHLQKYKDKFNAEQKKRVIEAFARSRDRKLFASSMRSIQFAGSPILAHNAKLFNCSASFAHSIRWFSEVFYLLLCGSGVTIGLHKKYMDMLPDLVSAKDRTGSVITYVIEDSIEGWADAVSALLNCYLKNTPYSGRKIVFDYSKIRAEGMPLKTSGGKAPGHNGLKQSLARIKDHLDYIIETLHQKRLKTIDVYDIVMHMSDAVLSGGIRRAAAAAIFELDDIDMMKSKTAVKVSKPNLSKNEENGTYEGYVTVNKRKMEVESVTEYEYNEMIEKKVLPWYRVFPWRKRANNSVRLISGKFTFEQFKEIFESTRYSGDPGFVFAESEDVLYNPCFEAGMFPFTKDGRPGFSFCNLTSVNGAAINSLEDFLLAVEDAAIVGTLQAGYTDFEYLENASREIAMRDSLLGVSITGFMDTPAILLDERNLYLGAKLVIKTNKEWSSIIGIAPAKRTTLVKPEGTWGLVAKSASGAHAHHAKRYWRRVQENRNNSIMQFFELYNPGLVEESKHSSTKTDKIIKFPVEVKEGTIVKDDLTAIEHLNIIRRIYENWVIPGMEDNDQPVTHNVSCTIEVEESEWDEVANYLFENQKCFGAVSLLGKSADKQWEQAPLERILEEDESDWAKAISEFHSVDYRKLIEISDETKVVEAAACSGNSCETL